MSEWLNTPKEELETTICLDYGNKIITLYTSKKPIAEKLKKEIGEPTKTYFTKNRISGVVYKRKIDSKDTKKLLSKGILVGQIKSNK